ncbi:MAG: hypothetical protein U0350_25755 [Caldilineaceae bacterium]
MKIRLNVIPILLLILTLIPRSMQAAPLAFATPAAQTTKKAAVDPQARLAEITQNDPTLSDDFSRSNGNWSTKSDDKDLTFAYKDRSFHIRIGKDNYTTWRTNTEANKLKLTDFYLEVNMTQIDGPPDGEFGVVFREVNTDNFYMFTIRQAGTYALWKHVDKEWQTVIDWTKSSAIHSNKKATNKLGLLAEADEITLFMNDEVLTQIQDDAFVQGTIGLALGTQKQGGLEVAFDNFNLWSLYAEPKDLSSRVQDMTEAAPAFTDDFKTDNGDWTTKSKEKDVSFTYKDDAFHILVDRKQWTAWTFNKQIDDLKLSDFYLEAEASQIDGPKGGEFGIVFRQTDSKNFYLYSISREGTYSLWKEVDGTWQPIIDWTNTDAIQTDLNATNKLAVLAEGPQLTLFLNDQVLFHLKDNAFLSGTVGLMTGTYADPGVEVAFSKLNIWPLKGSAEETPTAEETLAVDADAVKTHIEEITQSEPVFTDNFRRADSDWDTKSDDKDVAFTFVNRALHIRVAKKEWLTWIFNKKVDNLQLGDFYAESEISAVNTPDDAQFGLLFRFVDSKNFYKFGISRSGAYSLIKSVDNEWKTIVDWTKSNLIQTDAKARNKLGVLAEDSQITLLVNDEVLTQVTDDSFSSGSLGLMAGAYDKGNVEVAFNKLDIWALGGETTETPTAEEANTETVTPEATETPEETVTAEETITEEATITETPEETATPEETMTEEATKTPEATDTPAEEATATPTPKGTPTRTANGSAKPIVVKALSAQAFNTYKVRMEMSVDGKAGVQPMKGNLIIETTQNVAKNQSSILLDGSLVKDFISKEMKLAGMEIDQMTLYKTGANLLIQVTGNLNTCFKADPNDERFSSLQKVAGFADLLDSLAGKEAKLSGSLVGKETVNGIPTQHYLIDAEAMNASSGSSENDHMDSGEIWVALNGQYPVRLSVEGPTEISSFLGDETYKGRLAVTLDVANVNAGVNITLPAACQKPITMP